jgi:hypothetical protein
MMTPSMCCKASMSGSVVAILPPASRAEAS